MVLARVETFPGAACCHAIRTCRTPKANQSEIRLARSKAAPLQALPSLRSLCSFAAILIPYQMSFRAKMFPSVVFFALFVPFCGYFSFPTRSKSLCGNNRFLPLAGLG